MIHTRNILRRAAACPRLMSGNAFLERISGELKGIEEAGTWKAERVITSSMVVMLPCGCRCLCALHRIVTDCMLLLSGLHSDAGWRRSLSEFLCEQCNVVCAAFLPSIHVAI